MLQYFCGRFLEFPHNSGFFFFKKSNFFVWSPCILALFGDGPPTEEKETGEEEEEERSKSTSPPPLFSSFQICRFMVCVEEAKKKEPVVLQIRDQITATTCGERS